MDVISAISTTTRNHKLAKIAEPDVDTFENL